MIINFTGLWKADFNKSRLLTEPPQSLSIKIVHSEIEIQEQMTVTKSDGSSQSVIFKCPINGNENEALLNNKCIRGSARWEGEELIIESEFGGMRFRDCWSLSCNQQILTMEHRNDALAGQLTVLERLE